MNANSASAASAASAARKKKALAQVAKRIVNVSELGAWSVDPSRVGLVSLFRRALAQLFEEGAPSASSPLLSLEETHAVVHAVLRTRLADAMNEHEKVPKTLDEAVAMFEFGSAADEEDWSRWVSWCAEMGLRMDEEWPSRFEKARSILGNRARAELERVFTEYAPLVMGFTLFPDPASTPLIDLMGAHRVWISDAFPDRGLAKRLIRDRERLEYEFNEVENAARNAETDRVRRLDATFTDYHVHKLVEEMWAATRPKSYDVLGPCATTTAFTGAHPETRAQCLVSAPLRRAAALGFDSRLGTPSVYDPVPRTETTKDAAEKLDVTLSAVFGENAFDWSFVNKPDEQAGWIGHAFAHVGPSTPGPDTLRTNRVIPPTDDESATLKWYAANERVWRLTLMRVTGSHMPDADAETAYAEFRRIWRDTHTTAEHPGFFEKPPVQFLAEDPVDGEITMREIVADRRARVGSFAVEFLRASSSSSSTAATAVEGGGGENERDVETKLWSALTSSTAAV